MFRTFLSR